MSDDERLYRSFIDASFEGSLSAEDRAQLFSHLERCEACRAYYDRLGEIEAALSPGRAISAAAEERIFSRVVPAKDPPRRRLWASMAWILGAASAAAIAVAVLFVETPKPDAFRARGEGGVRSAGVSFFCVGPGPTGETHVVRKSDAARGPFGDTPVPALSCPLNAELQLTYSSPPGRALSMIAYGEGADHEVHWYAPREPDAPPIDLAANATDQALAWSTRLAVNHRPGEIQVRVRIFDRSTGDAPKTAAEALTAKTTDELVLVLDVGAP
jgi:anti-sigma factor RsiW